MVVVMLVVLVDYDSVELNVVAVGSLCCADGDLVAELN